jgi:membrane associated rhomboid family serine protease
MIAIDGYASKSENPMLGPPASTLVRFGAKDTGLIVFKNQYWRLFTPIMLHAGILHIVSNVFIQLRVGGYLNLVFGWKKWFIIYLGAGIFGNLCSCCFMPDSVGVGSSGAVLGGEILLIICIIYNNLINYIIFIIAIIIYVYYLFIYNL